jgi:hypothetical protein
MKHLLRFLFLQTLFLLLAVGCTTGMEETAVSTPPSPTPQPTATAVATVAAEPAATASHNDAYNPDITLLSTTGRPQFVTAYADW